MTKFIENPKRIEVIVQLNSTKRLRSLQKFGYLHHISSKMKYALLYIDKENQEKIIKELLALPVVKKVEPSPREELNMNFSESLDNEKARIQQLEEYEKSEARTDWEDELGDNFS